LALFLWHGGIAQWHQRAPLIFLKLVKVMLHHAFMGLKATNIPKVTI
jgi:hypothetical protein